MFVSFSNAFRLVDRRAANRLAGLALVISLAAYGYWSVRAGRWIATDRITSGATESPPIVQDYPVLLQWPWLLNAVLLASYVWTVIVLFKDGNIKILKKQIIGNKNGDFEPGMIAIFVVSIFVSVMVGSVGFWWMLLGSTGFIVLTGTLAAFGSKALTVNTIMWTSYCSTLPALLLGPQFVGYVAAVTALCLLMTRTLEIVWGWADTPQDQTLSKKKADHLAKTYARRVETTSADLSGIVRNVIGNEQLAAAVVGYATRHLPDPDEFRRALEAAEGDDVQRVLDALGSDDVNDLFVDS